MIVVITVMIVIMLMVSMMVFVMVLVMVTDGSMTMLMVINVMMIGGLYWCCYNFESAISVPIFALIYFRI